MGNSWNFTRLGKVQGLSQTELKEILGTGNATVTFSLSEGTGETEQFNLDPLAKADRVMIAATSCCSIGTDSEGYIQSLSAFFFKYLLIYSENGI